MLQLSLTDRSVAASMHICTGLPAVFSNPHSFFMTLSVTVRVLSACIPTTCRQLLNMGAAGAYCCRPPIVHRILVQWSFRIVRCIKQLVEVWCDLPAGAQAPCATSRVWMCSGSFSANLDIISSTRQVPTTKTLLQACLCFKDVRSLQQCLTAEHQHVSTAADSTLSGRTC